MLTVSLLFFALFFTLKTDSEVRFPCITWHHRPIMGVRVRDIRKQPHIEKVAYFVCGKEMPWTEYCGPLKSAALFGRTPRTPLNPALRPEGQSPSCRQSLFVGMTSSLSLFIVITHRTHTHSVTLYTCSQTLILDCRVTRQVFREVNIQNWIIFACWKMAVTVMVSRLLG